MSDELSYDELLRRYQQLQLRVTRFSAIEQELINTRDQLDHELVVYKRLNDFSRDALTIRNELDFFKLVTEAIIDIFETEGAFVDIERDNHNQAHFLFEGFRSEDEDQLREELNQCKQSWIENRNQFIIRKNSDFPEWRKLSSVLISNPIQTDGGWVMKIGAIISQERAPLYPSFDDRQIALFSVFRQQFIAILANIRNSRKNQEQMEHIAASELELKRLSLIATKAKSGVIISDHHGKIEWVNESFEQTTGYELKEVKGKKPKDFLQNDSVTNLEARLKLSKALAAKEDVEVTILNVAKNGNTYYNQLQITPVFNEDGKHINFIALQKDITAEEIGKLELKKINSRFELITQSSNIGIWEWNPNTQESVWNDVMIKMFQLSKDELTNCYRIFQEAIHPEDRQRALAESDLVVKGLEDVVKHEYRIILPKSLELRYTRAMVIAEKDVTGKTIRLVGSVEDITDTRLFEEKLLTKNKELTKINNELDQFVYSVSHDLRSPLLSIKGLLSLIEHSWDQPEIIQNYLSLIEKSVSRLDGTILEILDYSKNARLGLHLSELNVEDMVQQIFSDVAHLSEIPVTFTCDVSGSPLFVSDHFRLSTLLKNIISNAVKYRNRNISNPFVHVSWVNLNHECQLTIRDNGEGISTEHQEKVFDMFFRASGSSPGTGLGLYICREIVSKLQGTITLDSELGKGTIIHLTFPKIK